MGQQMGTKIVHRFRWFLPWQDDAEEAWLRRKSGEEGLHLVSVSPFCTYGFAAGEPAAYVYRLDFRRTPSKDRKDYLQLFLDAGWEHVGEMNGWHYFRRKAEPGEPQEILTDLESKIEKYRRALAFYGFFAFFSLMFFLRTMTDRGGYSGSGTLRGAWVVILVILVTAVLKLGARMRSLKKAAGR